MLELYLGGARSGKSALAEAQARASGLERCYLATAQALDEEMQVRIAHHQLSRADDGWRTVESPLQLAETLQQWATPERCILVDCLTLWLSNALHHQCWEAEREALLALLPQLPGRILLVSNEVGQGVVPLGALSRQFVDEAGRLHQALARQADRVVFVVAGLPQVLKGEPL